jgi:prepilin-type N-terminal cleavage/methylation domain-containing protein
MFNRFNRRRTSAYTLVEVLVVVLILLVLTNFALPAYITTVYASRMGTANANARALATAIQSKAITANAYDTTLADYAIDLGGSLPLNPCSGTNTGYTITATATTATVTATAGTNCGSWTPTTYRLTL